MYGSVEVTLYKQKHTNLGLTISGGADRGYPPRITTIKPGSIADKSDCLLVNDVIKSINGSSTANLTHEQIAKITKCADTTICLGLEYILTDSVKSTITKHAFIHLEPVNESLGITVRGGLSSLGNGIFPLTICRIRPRSCADKNGCLKQGDRILAIDGVQTRGLTCEESMKLLGCHKSGISLFIEYDVADIGAEGRQGSGPFEIEIEKLPTERLGASLVTFGENLQGTKRLLISHIRDGSIADRCGALQVGDLIETINGRSAGDLSLQEAIDLLSDTSARSIKLRILPCPEIVWNTGDVNPSNRMPTPYLEFTCPDGMGHKPIKLQSGGNRARNQSRSRKSNTSGRRGFHEELDFSWNSTPVDSTPVGWNIRNTSSECSRVNNFEDSVTSRSSYSRREKSHRLAASGRYKSSQYRTHFYVKVSSGAASTSINPAMVYGAGLCRTEEVEVVLEASLAWAQQQTGNIESRRHGANPFGFSLQPASPQTRNDEPLTNFPLIASVIPGGPAFQSGVIQAGDSLLAIQGDSPLGKTIDKLTARYLLNPALETSSSSTSRHLALVTQYTVAENVIPSSGVFDVRIIRRSSSLGINLQASRKSRPGEPLLISKVIPGSVASRCGSIHPGDILLAVNGVSLEACSITDAARLLQTSEEIVTLRIQKPDEDAATPISDEGLPSCCQSDLEIVRDDDNDFSLGVGGPFDMNDTLDDEFLSQSADESISHLPAPPPRPPRRYQGQKIKRTQQHRHGGGTARNHQQQLESEIGSDARRGNPSDSFSSDRFSENMCSGK
ncbi:unnamed protein product [Hymenolepis diminuta]|uniref:Glutamate receptor-interacting protein 1 n=1 Tax=Hymenolepis diminuta TaxID=6216 RepID=A0A0R3STH6_HYMDI|nr:unnamed protein product [Hymenolepis diminuta]